MPTADQQCLITAHLRRQAAQQQQGGQRGTNRQHRDLVELQVGPVTVAVLPALGDAKASEAARAFLQQQLGAAAGRSQEMLRPTKAGGRFIHGPIGWD